jgi:hypothetical protein
VSHHSSVMPETWILSNDMIFVFFF